MYKRLHQEDFCQALALMSEVKYQSDGGPGFTDLYNVIKSSLTVPALETQKLIQCIIFHSRAPAVPVIIGLLAVDRQVSR